MKYELVTETPIEGMAETTYVKLVDDNGIISIIPIDENNRDYQNYLAWLEENA